MNRQHLRRPGGFLLVCIAALTAGFSVATECAADYLNQSPPPPWPGPQGPIVFAEAEAFTITGEGWKVTDASRHFQAPFVAAMKTLDGTGAGDGTASLEVEVPAAGEYIVWVRHSQFARAVDGARAPFALRIVQDGKTVFDRDYDRRAGKAGASETPVWPRYDWHKSQDRIVDLPDLASGTADAEVLDPLALPGEKKPDGMVYAKLSKGKATLTLRKIGAKATHPHTRHVDCVLLTTDAKYEPDHRDFVPQTYLRVRLHAVEPEPVYFYTFLDHMREPWYRNIQFNKAGLSDSIRAPKDRLGPGDRTAWANISRLLYSGWTTNFHMHAQIVYGERRAAQATYSIDFARAPREDAIVKTVERQGPGEGIMIQVPHDMAEGRLPMADYDYAQQTADMAAKFPPVGFGKRARRFPLMTDLPVDGPDNDPKCAALERKALQWMGLSGITRLISDEDIADGFVWGLGHAAVYWRGPGGDHDPEMDKIEAGAKRSAEHLKENGHADHVVHVSLMDEAGATALEQLMQQKASVAAFQQWLAEKKILPMDLGFLGEDELTLTADRDHPEPRLYRLSQEFRALSIAKFFRLCTDTVRKHFPGGPGTTQNYSDGAVYLGNMYEQGNDYYVWFRDVQALEVAQSEDWTNSGASYQLCGWNVALLRSATKYHQQPIHMYCISSYGRRPLDIKLKAYTDISEGARQLSFYAYSPLYVGHERGWYQQWDRYAAVAEACHEIGAAEDVLVEAAPVQAPVAILYSISHDIWSAGHDSILSHDRQLTWMALKHAQVPVDILCEQDIVEGRLQAYKVAYAFGECWEPGVVQPLSEWIKAGGTLVLDVDAMTRDGLNRPSTAMDEALGLTRKPGQILQPIRHSSYYVQKLAKVQGQVKLEGSDATATLLFRRQPLEEQGKVLARFEDGAPAATVQPVEQGQVYCFGFPAGQAYIHGSRDRQAEVAEEKVRSLEFVAKVMAVAEPEGRHDTVTRGQYTSMPNAYHAAVRDLIVKPVTDRRLDLPVWCDTPLVIATLMTGKSGWVVPVANFTGAALEKVALRLRPEPAGRMFGPVRSSRLGELPTKQVGDALEISIPLESTDMVFAEWLPSR